MATPRGPVVTDLEEEFVSAEFAERPGVTVYRVTTYLDTGEFRCGIVSHDRDAVYHVPQSNESVSGIPIAPNVDGETDPRAIVRRLQMPEDYLFPTEKWPSSTSRRR